MAFNVFICYNIHVIGKLFTNRVTNITVWRAKFMQYSITPKTLARRRGAYGIDAPVVPVMLGALSLLFLALTIVFIILHLTAPTIIFLIYSVVLILSTTSYLYTTCKGKFQVWANLLTQ